MDEKATYVFPVNEYSFISVTGQPDPTNTDITEWMLSIRVVLRFLRPKRMRHHGHSTSDPRQINRNTEFIQQQNCLSLRTDLLLD